MLSRQLRSHHAISGLGCAAGVLVLTLLAYALLGFRAAIAVSTGALIVSLADIPVPRRNKLPLLLANLVQAPLVTLALVLTHHSTTLLALAIVLISFCSGMAAAWGRRAFALSYGMAMMMAFALARPDLPWPDQATLIGLQTAGGVLYIGYALLLARALDMSMRRRVVVDALYGFADYLRSKAAFFDPAQPLEAVHADLVRQQAALAEKLQTARDFAIDAHPTPEQQALSNGLFALIDVHEDMLANQADYAGLRRAYGTHPVMGMLAEATLANADAVEQLAGSGLTPGPTVLGDDLRPGLRPKLERAIEDLRQHAGLAQRPLASAIDVLARNLLSGVERLRGCEALLRTVPDTATPVDEVMQQFLSRASFTSRALREEARLDSPVLRYALRLTMAMLAGFLLSRHLPYATHGYWILLTIALVMRASFSQTKRRQSDRMVGNALGCLFTALLLHWVSAPALLLLVIFACIAVAHASVSVRYRYTVTAACVMSLLQLHLIAPGSFHISERLYDTAIGVALAYAFSRVLPSWERRSLPALSDALLVALREYIELALRTDAKNLHYRLARRHVQEALAALSDAMARMRDEPASQHLSLATLNELTTQSYLLLSHLATARRLMSLCGTELDSPHWSGLMASVRASLCGLLDVQHVPPDANTDFARLGVAGAGESASVENLRQRLVSAHDDARALVAAAHALAAGTAQSPPAGKPAV